MRSWNRMQENPMKNILKNTEAWVLDEEVVEQMAWKDLEKEMEQGFQGWEYKFNSVSSSRGDYPFITVTAGIGILPSMVSWQRLRC